MRIILITLFFLCCHFSSYAMSKKSGWWRAYKAPSVRLDTRKCNSPCEIEFRLRNRDKRLKNKDFSYLINFGDGTPALITQKSNIKHTYIARPIDKRYGWFFKYKLFKPSIRVVYEDKKSKTRRKFLVVKRSKVDTNNPPELFPVCDEAEGLTIKCKANATDDAGELADILWEFGDGNNANGEEVEHTYSSSGQYTLSVKAVDNKGSETLKSLDIEVIDVIKPEAIFYSVSSSDLENLNFIVGDEIHFNSSISITEEGRITSHSWLVDGVELSTTNELRLSSVEPKIYSLSLRVTNSLGGSDEESFEVTVSPDIKPEISISASSSFVVPAMLSLSATNTSSLIGPLSYKWSLYGMRSSSPTWSPQLSKVGKHEIKLTIIDGNGARYNTSRVIDTLFSGPYLESVDNVNVVDGFKKTINLEAFSEVSDFTVTVSPTNEYILINDQGNLLLDGRSIEDIPSIVQVSVKNSLGNYTKTISINKLLPELVAEIPAGFTGDYVIENSSSILNGFEVYVDEENSESVTSLKIYTANNELIMKSDMLLKNGVDIKAADGFSIFSKFDTNYKRNNSGLLVRPSETENRSVKVCPGQEASEELKEIRVDRKKTTFDDYVGYKGIPIGDDNKEIILGDEVEVFISDQGLSTRREELRKLKINTFLKNIENVVKDKDINVYLIDEFDVEDEVRVFNEDDNFALIYLNQPKSIYFNLSDAMLLKSKLSDIVWRPIAVHELRHVEQNKTIGCLEYEMPSKVNSFVKEADAAHEELKYVFSNTILKPFERTRQLSILGYIENQNGGEYLKLINNISSLGFQKMIKSEVEYGYDYPQFISFKDFGFGRGLIDFYIGIANGSVEPPKSFLEFYNSYLNTFGDPKRSLEDLYYNLLFPESTGGFFETFANSVNYGGAVRQAFLEDKKIGTEKKFLNMKELSTQMITIDVEQFRQNDLLSYGDTLRIYVEASNFDDLRVSYQRADGFRDEIFLQKAYKKVREQNQLDEFFYEIRLDRVGVGLVNVFFTFSGVKEQGIGIKVGQMLTRVKETNICVPNPVYSENGTPHFVSGSVNIELTFENESDGTVYDSYTTFSQADRNICFKKSLRIKEITNLKITRYSAVIKTSQPVICSSNQVRKKEEVFNLLLSDILPEFDISFSVGEGSEPATSSISLAPVHDIEIFNGVDVFVGAAEEDVSLADLVWFREGLSVDSNLVGGRDCSNSLETFNTVFGRGYFNRFDNEYSDYFFSPLIQERSFRTSNALLESSVQNNYVESLEDEIKEIHERFNLYY